MNKFIVTGYMNGNPTNKISKNGKSVTEFRVGVRKNHPSQTGRKTDYFNCVAFSYAADYVYKYCNNQSRVSLVGSLEIDDYTDKNGVKRYNPKFYVDQAEVLNTTVNAGDRMEQAEQPQEPSGAFQEIDPDEVDLPFI